MLTRSIDKIAQYSSYDRVDMISPHPLLMIAGSKADTRYFSEMTIKKAKEPKELFLIEGGTHVSMYDRDKDGQWTAVEKMSSFFKNYLQSANKSPEKKGYIDNKKAKITKV
jgi:uncharacterized protein